MNDTSKKEQFKFLIREFQSQPLPKTFARDLAVPLDSKKIVAVSGPRRSGKSFYFYTLVKKLTDGGTQKERILYVNFEDDRILPLKVGDLNALIEAYFELYPEHKDKEIFLFLDEIQNIEEWEMFVRRIHDKEKAKIFLTGSSSRLLVKEIAPALRGRSIRFGLYPLSFPEYLRFRGLALERDFEHGSQRFQVKKLLEDYLEFGGFPEVVLERNAVVRNKILEEYFESLVYRDLSERHKMQNTELLKDILKYLFSNSASLFSVNAYYRAVKQSISVSRETIAEYLRLIQDTGYFTLLPKFSWSLKEQKANPQKIICLDLGLRNRISFRFSEDTGKAVENLAGMTLLQRAGNLFYWEGKREVDFVLQDKKSVSGINVTFGPAIHEREIEALAEFQKQFQSVKELVLITRETEEQRKSIHMVPLWKWLLG